MIRGESVFKIAPLQCIAIGAAFRVRATTTPLFDLYERAGLPLEQSSVKKTRTALFSSPRSLLRLALSSAFLSLAK